MWTRLSLHTRFFLPLGIIFVSALLIGAVSLILFVPPQLADETAPATRSAKAVADALNGALRKSANPEQTLDAFATSLGTSEAIQFRRAGVNSPPHPVEVQTPLGRVPRWFVDLLAIPEIGAAFPVMIGGNRVGDIIFSPDISAEIFETWVGFVAIAFSIVALTLLTGIIAYFTVGTALAPLRNIGEGLSRLRQGDYDQPIPPSGPPELRRSAEVANELARTLSRLSDDNRNLLHKIVSLQDDERRDMARDLHDELGPLLFGIRANAVALMEAIPPGHSNLAGAAQGILQSVEALQQANRRVLDRLRPLYIDDLGLEKSIQTLLQNARAQAPGIKLTSRIDARMNGIDGLHARTVYRVIQEGITNVLRHAKAHATNIDALITDGQVIVEISDDGIGFAPDRAFGRGLTGMQERVRALNGTLELLREGGRTCVRCRLPTESPAGMSATREA
jgi:two-component system, NarL family, sensor histidine kinase UhpB